MTRGRKATAPAALDTTEFASATPPALAEQESRAVANQAAMEDTLVLGRFVGRVEMIDAYQTWGNAAKVAAFETAKNSKAYRFLINPRTKMYFGSLEEFCEVAFGNGYERLRQLLNNRNAVGQDLFDQSERIGLRQIDYNAIKALPAPEQELVQQAIKESASREEVIDLLQELAARHHNEREELNKKLAEITDEHSALERIAAERRDEIDTLKVKNRKRSADPWPEEIAGINDEIGGVGTVADEALSKFLTFIDAAEVLIDNAEEGSEKYRAAKSVIHRLGAGVERLCHLTAGLRAHFETRLSGYIADDKSHVLPNDENS